MKKIILSILSILIITGCGGSSSSSDSSNNNPDPSITRVATEEFGVSGNLWKPAGDSHGSSPRTLVVILGPHHNVQFDHCEACLKDGRTFPLTCINNVPWTHTPYSCFANGSRQHWRSFTRCQDFAEVKATCYSGNKEYLFKAPAGKEASVCTRFG